MNRAQFDRMVVAMPDVFRAIGNPFNHTLPEPVKGSRSGAPSIPLPNNDTITLRHGDVTVTIPRDTNVELDRDSFNGSICWTLSEYNKSMDNCDMPDDVDLRNEDEMSERSHVYMLLF